MEIVTSWMETGLKQGARNGKVAILLNFVHSRFGMLEPALENRIQHLPDAELDNLSLAFLGLSDLADLTSWLDQHEVVESK